MRHVILPVHGFHFSKVTKGHNIKEKATKIDMIFGAFAFIWSPLATLKKMKTMHPKNNILHNVYVLKYIYKFLILRYNS